MRCKTSFPSLFHLLHQLDGASVRRRLSSGLLAAGNLFEEMPLRILTDWNSTISDYWRLGNETAACRVFTTMPHRNPVSWTAMVTGYAKSGRPEKARSYIDAMPERTTASWNAMLSGNSQNGLVEPALQLFAAMVRSGPRPDEKTWATVLSACSAKGDLSLANVLVGSMLKRKLHPNCFVETAMLDMYAKCGDLSESRRIFDGMRHRNPFSWNAMISAHTHAGNLAVARALFLRMPGRNVVSWNSIISGLIQNSQWVEVIDLFRDMVGTGEIEPDGVTMASMISACGHLGTEIHRRTQHKAGRVCPLRARLHVLEMRKSGSKMFDEMSKRNIFSYNSMVHGFAIHGLSRGGTQTEDPTRPHG